MPKIKSVVAVALMMISTAFAAENQQYGAITDSFVEVRDTGGGIDLKVSRDIAPLITGFGSFSRGIHWRQRVVQSNDQQWPSVQGGVSGVNLHDASGMGVEEVFFSDDSLVVVLSSDSDGLSDSEAMKLKLQNGDAVQTPEPGTYLILGSCLFLLSLRRSRQVRVDPL